ncbi:hypothetical protein P8452_53948 [Trifolium repens]|nr:hypothetical protein P8452_53948 [Trifolium repens]
MENELAWLYTCIMLGFVQRLNIWIGQDHQIEEAELIGSALDIVRCMHCGQCQIGGAKLINLDGNNNFALHCPHIEGAELIGSALDIVRCMHCGQCQIEGAKLVNLDALSPWERILMHALWIMQV